MKGAGVKLTSPPRGNYKKPSLIRVSQERHKFASNLHLRPELAHTHAPSVSIAPDTQTYPFTRQMGQYTRD